MRRLQGAHGWYFAFWTMVVALSWAALGAQDRSQKPTGGDTRRDAAAAGLPTRTVDFVDLTRDAFELTLQPFLPQPIESIPALDPPADHQPGSVGLVFDEANAITATKLDDRRNTYVYARPRAGLDRLPFHVYVDKNDDGTYDLKTWVDAAPDYGSPIIQPPITPANLPDAGKVLSRLVVGHLQPGAGFPQFFDVNSNGYVRFNGFLPQIVGSSYRVAVHNVFEPGEDFPRFLDVYYSIDNPTTSRLMALIDGEGFTGATTMNLTPGPTSEMHVTTRLFPRREITVAKEPYTGPVGYSSMFWKDERDTPADATDEAHDADWIVVGYDWNGDAVVDLIREKQIGNPDAVTVTDFDNLGTGRQIYVALENRDRVAGHYAAYASAEYHRRSSYSIKVVNTTVRLSAILHETPTRSEFDDNVTVHLAAKNDLARAVTVGDFEEIEYVTSAYVPVDTDGDGLTDQLETLTGTDTTVVDTDGDSYGDREELMAGHNPSSSTVFSFTDPVLASGVTAVKAVHFEQLRNAVNMLRKLHNLIDCKWTERIESKITTINAAHVKEIRTCLSEVYQKAGRRTPTYEDEITTPVTLIKAQHVRELRAAVNGL